MKRILIGTAAALVTMAALTAVMIPFRHHVSIATTALVLIVPVIVGTVSGGFVAGMISVGAGFLIYVVFFIQPYLTWYVGKTENWVPLGVYVIVMVPVARVVASMNTARQKERQRGAEIRQLFELSDLLVADKPLDELLAVIVTTLAEVFGSRKVALLLPVDERLQIVASSGEPLSPSEMTNVLMSSAKPETMTGNAYEQGDLLAIALTAAARPIGSLVLCGEAAVNYDREPLMIFANQIALAVERAQLQEEALKATLTEGVARLAKTLVAAVSHDLRAPLASIKASSSTLSDADIQITTETRRRLAKLIDIQADRLAELVQSLLDMSRIQAGVLEPRCTIMLLSDLVNGVVRDLTSSMRGHAILVDIPSELPPIDVDIVLISRVLTNILMNAARHSPKGSSIAIGAVRNDAETIEVSVTDHGPGVPADRRDEIFGLLARRDNDTGAGLGLSIAKTFVEAHQQRIWVDNAADGGAVFSFTLPVAKSMPEELRLA